MQTGNHQNLRIWETVSLSPCRLATIRTWESGRQFLCHHANWQSSEPGNVGDSFSVTMQTGNHQNLGIWETVSLSPCRLATIRTWESGRKFLCHHTDGQSSEPGNVGDSFSVTMQTGNHQNLGMWEIVSLSPCRLAIIRTWESGRQFLCHHADWQSSEPGNVGDSFSVTMQTGRNCHHADW